MQPADREYRSMVLRLSDLAIIDDVIENVTFFGCQIIGPAIILPLGSTEISNCTWDGDIEHFIWRLPDTQKTVIGAIGLKDCRLLNCRMTRIGLAVVESQVDLVRAGFQPG